MKNREETLGRIRALLGFRSWYYREAFTGQAGKYALADLIKVSGFWNPSHTPGDPYQTAFNEGQRRIVHRIIKLSNMAPEDIDSISKMLTEQEDRLGPSQLEDY